MDVIMLWFGGVKGPIKSDGIDRGFIPEKCVLINWKGSGEKHAKEYLKICGNVFT